MKINNLFTPFSVGKFDLSHRIVLAPLTRIRADEETLAPTKLNVEYYAQRATPGGLLISEAVYISPEGMPIWSIYKNIKENGGQAPGIWTSDQVQGWQMVTKAVHSKGGLISCQLLHAGRVAQPEIAKHPLVEGTDLPIPSVSSSATPITPLDEKGNDYNWDQKSVIPRALETEEIARICSDYRLAAINALEAGFDLIELHAAHGYLIEQFLCDGVNTRDDKYGGSIKNRARILFEVIETLIDVVGEERLGVRLSPVDNDPITNQPNQIYFGVVHSKPELIYKYVINKLSDYNLAYLFLTEPRVGVLSNVPAKDNTFEVPESNYKYREIYQGTLMGAGGFTPLTARKALSEGNYDLIAFGRWFLSNPDLPERIKNGHKLNVYDRDTFYGGNEIGYTDYPDYIRLSKMNKKKYKLISQSSIGRSLS